MKSYQIELSLFVCCSQKEEYYEFLSVGDIMTKIFFLHNTAMWYRRPFFKKLSEMFNIYFVFTDLEVSRDVYGVELCNEIEGLEGVKYEIYKKSAVGFSMEATLELLNNEYDVIVDSLESIQALVSFSIAKFRKKPIIFWSEEWDWKEEKSFVSKLKLPIKKFIALHSNAFIVPGTKHKGYFVSLGASPDNIFIVPNVSNITVKDIDYEKRNRLVEQLDVKNKKIVLYVGRLIKRKGVDYLVEAFSKLRIEKDDIVLVIIGRGECKEELELLSKNLGIENSIHFMDYVADDLLPAYYLLCNICVIPSIVSGIGDPWVFIVNEAMYFGKPVIVTDAVGAAFDMVKNGENGFMVPEKDVNALYSSMKIILTDRELELNMGIKSKKVIEENYRYENMINGFKEAIECTLKKTRI